MTASDDRVRANLRHIVQFEAKPYPNPQARTAVTRGFEKVAFPKIVKELKDTDLIIKQKSLLAARELLTPSESLVQCIAAGITPAIIPLLKDEDDVVRERAAGTLRCLAVKELGCRDLVQHGAMAALVAALEDSVTGVRDEAYATLIEACRLEVSKREMVALESALPRVMALVLEEEESRRVAGLQILAECATVRHNAAAVAQLVDNASAVPHLVMLLLPPQPRAAQQLAASLLNTLLAAREDARLVAVNVSAVDALLNLIDPSQPSLANAASAALGALTSAKEAKYAALECDGPARLVAVLGCGQDMLVIYVMEIITNVAEAPEARPMFEQLGVTSILEGIRDGATSDHMKRAAADALRRCHFKHWPVQPRPMG